MPLPLPVTRNSIWIEPPCLRISLLKGLTIFFDLIGVIPPFFRFLLLVSIGSAFCLLLVWFGIGVRVIIFSLPPGLAGWDARLQVFSIPDREDPNQKPAGSQTTTVSQPSTSMSQQGLDRRAGFSGPSSSSFLLVVRG